jgi:hypothetical protein
MSLCRQVLFEQSLATRSEMISELLGRSSEQPKKRKKVQKKEPRRGDVNGVGVSRWRIKVGDKPWEELRRPGRYDEGSWDGKRFQSIYGVPAKLFDQLVAEARTHGLAGKLHHGDGCRGPMSKPLELKVAAVLEINQAGLLFKTAERLYDISKQVLEKFYHDFTRLQVLHEYGKHVYPPRTREEIDDTLSKMAKRGFPGAITMFDGTKWHWLNNCPAAQRFAHIGKEGYPTRLFLVAGNQNRVIHHISGSHPGVRNDMTAARFDDFLQSLHRRTAYANESFELKNENGQLVSMSGLYSITDNGFHKWRCTQKQASEMCALLPTLHMAERPLYSTEGRVPQ